MILSKVLSLKRQKICRVGRDNDIALIKEVHSNIEIRDSRETFPALLSTP